MNVYRWKWLGRVCFRCAAVLHVMLCAFASVAGGQSVSVTTDASIGADRILLSGTVRDAEGRPIEAAEVRVGTRDAARTDSTGAFVVRGQPVETVHLLVRRLGYDADSVTVPVVQGASRITVNVVLKSAPTQLQTVVAEGKAYDKLLWDNGFYQRQRTASGVFFDNDYVEHFGGNGLGSLVREAARVDVRRIGTQDYAFSSIAGAPCRMHAYIDGRYQREGMPGPNGTEGLGLGELIGFRSIYAVEVYPRANFVPTQFTRMGPGAGPQRPTQRIPLAGNIHVTQPKEGENSDAACGAIVIWTKPVGAEAP